MSAESNPYVRHSPVPPPSNAMETMKNAIEKWGKKLGETAKKTEDLAGNLWQHLKTGPSLANAAMGRIAEGTKVISEGGYEKMFRQTFEIFIEERLEKSYACYILTSAGPIIGTLYLSTARLAFCGANPHLYKIRDQKERNYYKVVIPLHHLRSVIPSTNKVNPAEKYIQVVSINNHEFWFMGFMNYDSALKHLQEAVQVHCNFQRY